LTTEEVAQRCGTHPHATEKLLNALVGVGCLQVRDKHYRVRRSARSWVLKDGKNSFRDQKLIERISRALRPGGVVAIWEPVRQDPSAEIRQLGGLLDLFFGFFSEAGTWSAAEVASWFQAAGLEAQKPRHPRMMRDLALHVGRKPT
jgi:hypothetical protein